MKKELSNQEYNTYVEGIVPKHNTLLNCLKAFIVGGLICLFGEFIFQFLQNNLGIEEKNASSYVTLILVFISVVLTIFNLYFPITKFAGAGSLVPITGFANSVASPAIEFQKEGQVFGIGVKIFTIAGPVILYGVFTSFIVGLIYYLLKLGGIL